MLQVQNKVDQGIVMGRPGISVCCIEIRLKEHVFTLDRINS
jgi:hypothetical protein